MKTKQEIYDICCNCGINEYKFKLKYPEEYIEFSKISFPEYFKFKQKIYHWTKNDFDLSLGVCPVCGNRCRFLDIVRGYSAHCSVKCAANSPVVREKTKNTNLELYGNACSLHSEEIDKKSRQTCLKNHRVLYPMQSKKIQDKAKQTYINTLGVDHPSKSDIVKHKKIIKCRSEHNADYYFETEEFKEKSRRTKYERHGDEYYSNREKAWNTCYVLYGKHNPFCVEKFKNKSKETCLKKHGVEYSGQSELSKEKAKQTCLARYGVDHYSKSNKRAVNDRNKFEKLNDLYKKSDLNTSGGISKLELRFYEYLISKYDKDDIIYNYMSDLYPFHCDFHIKSLDLYIELNAFWTHGNKPFDSSCEDDLNKVRDWKTKNNKYYNSAVYVWTVSDVKKRNTAKQNNLNYIEIFENKLSKVIEVFEKQLMLLTKPG